MRYWWFICAGPVGPQGNTGQPGSSFPGPPGAAGPPGPVGPQGFIGELDTFYAWFRNIYEEARSKRLDAFWCNIWTMFGVPSITDQIHTRKIKFYGNSVNHTIACVRYCWKCMQRVRVNLLTNNLWYVINELCACLSVCLSVFFRRFVLCCCRSWRIKMYICKVSVKQLHVHRRRRFLHRPRSVAWDLIPFEALWAGEG